MEKVIAVVVSYNRQNLLSECIKALRNQTRRPNAILVVNNGSTDNTEPWLKTQQDVQFITQNNVGSGGGFNAGISHAYKEGYSWVWCMDDDGYPKEDALEQLLQHNTNERALLNCAVVNKNDRKSFVWKTGNFPTIDQTTEPLIKGVVHPFNGTLIHRAIIEKVGLPKPYLFLWGDETEYWYRIMYKYNFPVYTVTASIHYHPPAIFSYKKDWDLASSWKMYFYMRNRLCIQKAKFSNSAIAFIHYVCFVVAMIGIVMVFQKTKKLKKLSFLMWPLSDALKNNYSATPSIILEKLNSNRQSLWHFPFKTTFQNTWQLFFSGNQQNATKAATA